MASDEPRVGAKRRKDPPLWVGLTVLIGGVLLIGFALALPSLNKLNQEWVPCEVTRVLVQRGGNNSVSPWRVSLKTKECGTVSYAPGSRRDVVEELAEQFEPGHYEFKMGMVSQWAAKGYMLNTYATAEDYRRIGEQGAASQPNR